MAKKKSVLDFYEMKKTGEKITFLTAYDFPTAQFAEAYGPDMLLVGDSLGICVYGYQGTIPVVMGHIGLTPQSSGQLYAQVCQKISQHCRHGNRCHESICGRRQGGRLSR